jgi:propanol-preferring alcohol dehydrogenase
MRAVRLIAPKQPLELQEIPVPPLDDNGVLVRVKAAGICHSDAHYRAGTSPAYPLPLTLGHEVAGVVERVGSRVTRCKPGDRVCLHYMLTCGSCYYCTTGNEQFCDSGKMIGHYTDGGYADFISVPERSVLTLPEEIPFEAGATLMCASATSLHALRKGRLKGGESVAVFGAGGLGQSAVQLARALGARQVFAVDLNPAKLALAEEYGARPIDAGKVDPAAEIKRLTGGRGADVALELIGLPQTMKQALRSLSVFGRAVVVGITTRALEVDTYHELLGPETELIGSNDHLLQELPLLLELARSGALDTSKIVSRTVPLEAGPINAVLDELEHFSGESVRTVIAP